MTDTDPRLEAVASDIRICPDCGGQKTVEFESVEPQMERSHPCIGTGDCVGHPHDCYDHPRNCGCTKAAAREEVMPHKPGPVHYEGPNNATAPVMGADPPWLDQWALTVHKNRLATSSLEAIKHIAREAIAFANAQSAAAAGILSDSRSAWPDPTPEMQVLPLFEAIWSVIKTWDIAVPEAYSGYCGAMGNHVRAILDAINAQPPSEAEIDAGWAVLRHHSYSRDEVRTILIAAAKARSVA